MGGGGGRERERGRQTDRQTDKERQRQTDRQTARADVSVFLFDPGYKGRWSLGRAFATLCNGSCL